MIKDQLYRVLAIVDIGLIVWNLFISIGVSMSSAWQHTPFIINMFLLLWVSATIIGWILLKIINKKKIIVVAMIFFGILPTLSLLKFSRALSLNYIVSWEDMHCVKSIKPKDIVPGGVNYEWFQCDNGDLIEKSINRNDMKRIFYSGGLKNTHYPYSWLY